MLSFIIVVIVVLVYLLLQRDGRMSSKYLAATLIAYVAVIFSMIFYLSKDSYYYNIVDNYFSLPKSVWKYLMFVDVPRNIIIRLLNLSSLAVIYFGYHFSISYRKKLAMYRWFDFRRILPVLLGLQIFAYDPDIQYFFYFLAYPRFLPLRYIHTLMEAFHGITVAFNIGVILYSIVQLGLSYREVHLLRFLRTYLIGEGVCYTLIMISYIIIFWFSPSYLTKVSKVADYVVYLSIPLSRNRVIYTAYPYYLTVTTLACAFCIYELAKIKRQMAKKEFTITKQIDAADTTSKIFCHYMKNEILAIQSEIEILNPSRENEEGIKEVLNRCRHLYERLDTIHRGTKTSKLNLEETDIRQYITGILENMKINLRSCELAVSLEVEAVSVMLDQMYFEQAVKNIIENALDAMEAVPPEQRKLTVRLQRASNWIVLSIQDTGTGISEKDMKNIFTPLYSSKSIAKHWGIGLALAHRIIMAHDGKIEVESQENAGTDFKIFLPDIGKYISY
ncbi:signal transduction histidine kinase [Anaerotaenia torta]|uniref:sensor histidine kinase n=1 Tax=Anaerotaenia torta TaxID=433293 RepID=UPI003D25996F